eukprot:5626491-Prymnesium_polylepis.1
MVSAAGGQRKLGSVGGSSEAKRANPAFSCNDASDGDCLNHKLQEHDRQTEEYEEEVHACTRQTVRFARRFAFLKAWLSAMPLAATHLWATRRSQTSRKPLRTCCTP